MDSCVHTHTDCCESSTPSYLEDVILQATLASHKGGTLLLEQSKRTF